jgi:dienelactone hydrolase
MADEDLQQFDFPERSSDEARKYKSRTVFWLGAGPGVVLMHELPGLTEYVADFGRQIADKGYTVFMPVIFGSPFPGPVGALGLRLQPLHQPRVLAILKTHLESGHRLVASTLC